MSLFDSIVYHSYIHATVRHYWKSNMVVRGSSSGHEQHESFQVSAACCHKTAAATTIWIFKNTVIKPKLWSGLRGAPPSINTNARPRSYLDPMKLNMASLMCGSSTGWSKCDRGCGPHEPDFKWVWPSWGWFSYGWFWISWTTRLLRLAPMLPFFFPNLIF